MHEIEQKILDMTLEEFKEWEVPKGWKLLHVSGHKKQTAQLAYSGGQWYFSMCVTIEKEKDNAIL